MDNLNIEPDSRHLFWKARTIVQIRSRFLIGLFEQGMLLIWSIEFPLKMAGKEPTRPNLRIQKTSVFLTSLEVKFLTCSTVDFPKSRHLVIRTGGQKDNSPFSTLWNLECLFPWRKWATQDDGWCFAVHKNLAASKRIRLSGSIFKQSMHYCILETASGFHL